MVALAIWYDQTTKDDEGNVVIRVSTAAELDELVNRILGETAEHDAPPMIQVVLSGVKRSPALEVGLGKEKGFIGYTSRTEGGWTIGDGDPNAVVSCIYMGNHSEVPASVEVPLATVRRGLHEFLATGERPSVVESDVAS
ncbi:Immunity protein Imm1 [Amycolatopsis marina]|uniref:Immunity protein Imm1 n=1 Tax=Amycolatopsis marina TaxID=490629 RepID=A0A1I1CQI5_9PSEU|nr:Imm1 family immunity protein [Amycolatopsis marina]SFB63148.1 Immunity protein Imm1 [Amycolatopsis marina]